MGAQPQSIGHDWWRQDPPANLSSFEYGQIACSDALEMLEALREGG